MLTRPPGGSSVPSVALHARHKAFQWVSHAVRTPTLYHSDWRRAAEPTGPSPREGRVQGQPANKCTVQTRLCICLVMLMTG